jgi:hypothetical protein
MLEPAIRPGSLAELSGLIGSTFAIPLQRWLLQSAVLHEARTQRRLDDWLGAGAIAA